jgi:hypothetical protein
MQSKVFWALSPASLAVKRCDRGFAHAQLIDGQRVKSKNSQWSSGQGYFWTVKNLDCGRSSGHSTYGSDHPLVLGKIYSKLQTIISEVGVVKTVHVFLDRALLTSKHIVGCFLLA